MTATEETEQQLAVDACVTAAGPQPRTAAGWRRLFTPAWAAPLAAAVLLGLAVGVWWLFFNRSALGEAQAALRGAYHDARAHESRVSGFDYAPLDQIRDAAAGNTVSLAREHAEILVRSLAQKKPGPASRHLLGRLYLAKQEFDKALEQLKAAQAGDPHNAYIYNDLGAARLERASTLRAGEGDRFAAAGESLNYLSQALDLAGSLNEALFNRALCFEMLGNSARAKEDWENYLKKDPHSPWTEEARRKLAKISQQSHALAPSGMNLRDSLAQALRSGNEEAAWQALSLGRSQTGNAVVAQLIDDFLTLSAQGNAIGAKEALQVLKYAGDLEWRRVGDRFTADLARYYEKASPQQRATVLQARTLLTLGDTRRNQSVDEADRLFREARQLFSRAGNQCEVSLTDLYSGKNLIWASKLDEALSKLQQLAQSAEEQGFLWLQSQAFTQLHSVHLARNEFSESLDYAHRSLALAEQISDYDSQADRLVTIAYLHYLLGEYRAASGYLEQYASLASVTQFSRQVSWRNCQAASFNFAALGLSFAALEYQKDALRLAEGLQAPVFKANAYTALGWLYGESGKYAEGISSINQAIAIGESNQNDPVGQSIIAYSALRLGNLYRRMGQFDQALASYERQFTLGSQMSAPFYSYGAHQGKFLTYAAQNNTGAALEELRVVLGLFEKYRAEIVQESIKNSFFDTTQEIYDAAIRFAYSALNDPRLAFEYSELSRARALLDVMAKPVARTLAFAEVQARLPNNVQIVQYAVLNDALIIWVLTPDNAPGEIQHVQQEISASVLANKVSQYLQQVSKKPQPSQTVPVHEAEELYDILIRPIRHLLKNDRQLCLIPDKALCYLPFGALLSLETHQYLLEEFALSEAPSASTFVACTETAGAKGVTRREALLSVGNPAFDRARFPDLDSLISAEDEAREVARYYFPDARVISGSAATEASVKAAMTKADIIHIATHGLLDEQSALNSGLVLAADQAPEQSGANPETDGLLHAYEIYGLPLGRARLVVLSTCRSGVETFHRGEGMVGLARPFLAAGAPLVISSLWKVDSEATKELMIRFHKYRKQLGLPEAQALRRAQRELLHGGDEGYRHPFYWAAFSLVGGWAKAS